jgi:NTP pyrophosphatase (non-canonical NTP hydrolase)
MDHLKEFEEIRDQVPVTEILTVVAEEAAELTHAALKLRRTMKLGNPTDETITFQKAKANLYEETADVLCALLASGFIGEYELDTLLPGIIVHKFERWVDRLKEQRQKAGELV